jgi:hypothetical protein
MPSPGGSYSLVRKVFAPSRHKPVVFALDSRPRGSYVRVKSSQVSRDLETHIQYQSLFTNSTCTISSTQLEATFCNNILQ